MRYPRRLRLGAILVVCSVAAAVSVGTANAGPVVRDTIDDQGSYVLDDFCDVPGLDVEVDFTLDARTHIVARGRDRLAYFLQHGTRTETITNPDNGRSVTSTTRVTEKDMRVTDNGDGTLTVLVLATGNATLYAANGKAIARQPGQLRFELLIDDGGTPIDPSDDEVIEFLGNVKGSTGRSDDYCAAAVPALT